MMHILPIYSLNFGQMGMGIDGVEPHPQSALQNNIFKLIMFVGTWNKLSLFERFRLNWDPGRALILILIYLYNI